MASLMFISGTVWFERTHPGQLRFRFEKSRKNDSWIFDHGSDGRIRMKSVDLRHSDRCHSVSFVVGISNIFGYCWRWVSGCSDSRANGSRNFFDSGLTFNLYYNVILVNLKTTNSNFLNVVAAGRVWDGNGDVSAFTGLEGRLIDHRDRADFARPNAGEFNVTGKGKAWRLVGRLPFRPNPGQPARVWEERILAAGRTLKNGLVHREGVGRRHCHALRWHIGRWARRRIF